MKTTDEAAGNPADFTWSNISQLPHGKPAQDLGGKGKEHLVMSGGEAGNPADFTWSNIPQLPHGKPAKDLSGKGKEHLIKPQGVRAEVPTSTTCPILLSSDIDCLPRISVERVRLENQFHHLFRFSSFPAWICSYFELKDEERLENPLLSSGLLFLHHFN